MIVVHQQVNVHEGHRIYRHGAVEGLPRPGAQHVTVTPHRGTVWVGTPRGLLRYGRRLDSQRTYWKALLGPRWLPGRALTGSPHSSSFFRGQQVRGMAALAFDTSRQLGPNRRPLIDAIVVLTDGGVAVVSEEAWTLREKAAHLEAMMRPRHLRFNLTDSASLRQYGNVSSWYGVTTDNDGLHTAMYVMAEAYRFAATGAADAQQRGMEAFAAMEFLNSVTGITGYPARSVVRILRIHQGGEWWPSPTHSGWTYKGNTSSDESDHPFIVMHLFFFKIVYF